MKKDTKRLDSIKAANQSIDRKQHQKRRLPRNYFRISWLKGYATTLDISGT
ncbi:MAG: hypothetical protein CM1200mP23_4580 [Nitrososphaerota archaeon]|nr:MAG: hypothetical protein CM1200mP23_4580 [Nitrososphaerota archaeon]